jgi:hypothetical protein
MGYVYEETVYKLVFEGRFEGLEVSASELSLEELLDFSEFMWIDMSKSDAKERIYQRTEFMIKHIPSWNLEEKDGTPVPVTTEALLSKGKELHSEIMGAWLREIVGMGKGPLARENKSSSDGSDLSDVDLSMIPMSPIGEPAELS